MYESGIDTTSVNDNLEENFTFDTLFDSGSDLEEDKSKLEDKK